MLRSMCAFVVTLSCCGPVATAEDFQLRPGTCDLASAGPLAIGPQGVLFVGDPKAATIYAIDVNDGNVGRFPSTLNIADIDQNIADLLGTTRDDILINDLAANPARGEIFFSVSRGRGPDALPVLLRLRANGELDAVSLENVPCAKATIGNAPEDKLVGEGRRRSNRRLESITDLMYINGRVFVAGLSNEEFASKLRSIPFPFSEIDPGTSVEIFHGAHGGFETRSPVRTFTTYEIDEIPHLLAAYTCTPLVKFPIDKLQPGEKIVGTTIAELGNRNRPLDMVVYQQDGRDYILMANSSRGLMKISTNDIADIEGITERISGTAGLPYETIDGIEGVVQLDRYADDTAVVLIQTDSGGQSLQTIPLP